jgi:hypothetical protein
MIRIGRWFFFSQQYKIEDLESPKVLMYLNSLHAPRNRGLTFLVQTEVIHGLVRLSTHSNISLRLHSFWIHTIS